MKQLNEKDLENVSGGNEEIVNPVTLTFSGNNMTISSGVTLKGAHLDLFYNGLHHGFSAKKTYFTTYTFENIHATIPVKYTVKAVFPDNTKKITSFDDPTEYFTCTF